MNKLTLFMCFAFAYIIFLILFWPRNVTISSVIYNYYFYIPSFIYFIITFLSVFFYMPPCVEGYTYRRRGKCYQCQDCGLNRTVLPCTTKQNTVCSVNIEYTPTRPDSEKNLLKPDTGTGPKTKVVPSDQRDGYILYDSKSKECGTTNSETVTALNEIISNFWGTGNDSLSNVSNDSPVSAMSCGSATSTCSDNTCKCNPINDLNAIKQNKDILLKNNPDCNNVMINNKIYPLFVLDESGLADKVINWVQSMNTCKNVDNTGCMCAQWQPNSS